MKTFIVVFIAVLLANLSSLAIYEIYQQYKEINVAAMEAQEQIDLESSQVNADLNRVQESSMKIAEESRQKELQKSAESLCDYWTSVVEKDPTGLNEALKNKACLRHKKLQSASPTPLEE